MWGISIRKRQKADRFHMCKHSRNIDLNIGCLFHSAPKLFDQLWDRDLRQRDHFLVCGLDQLGGHLHTHHGVLGERVECVWVDMWVGGCCVNVAPPHLTAAPSMMYVYYDAVLYTCLGLCDLEDGSDQINEDHRCQGPVAVVQMRHDPHHLATACQDVRFQDTHNSYCVCIVGYPPWSCRRGPLRVQRTCQAMPLYHRRARRGS